MNPKTSKPWNPWSARLRAIFGGPVQKLTVDADFTCPNRDGSKAFGGCSYCANAAFSPAHRLEKPVSEQLQSALRQYRWRRPDAQGIAYFQAFTNTYAPLERLRSLWEEALAVPGVVGLAVGTRPDCVPEPVADLLADMAQKTRVFVEIGFESAEDAVLQRVNRQCRIEDARQACRRLKDRGLMLTAHAILGLPGESPEHDLRLAALLAETRVDAVKLQHFYIAAKTPLAKDFREGAISVSTAEAYRDRLISLLEILPPELGIERLVGECDPKHVLAPHWAGGKTAFLLSLEDECRRRGTRQGRRFEMGERPLSGG